MFSFARMLYDEHRCAAYAQALRQSIRPGSSIVLDIGTGTGFFAVLASRLGARKIYAVEPDPVINVARQVAVQNGCAENIEFTQTVSTELELPEKADIIISDLRGSTPFKGLHIPSVIDARQRLLAKKGIIIARRDTVYAAIAEALDQFQAGVTPDTAAKHGVDMSLAMRMARNEKQTVLLGQRDLLTKPAIIAEIDYRTVREPNLNSRGTSVAERDGIAYGIAMWFEVHAADGISFTTGPLDRQSVYATALFPLERPVPVHAGDTFAVEIRNCLTTDGDYVWEWRTRVSEGTGAAKADFAQSTLFAAVPTSDLRKHSESFIPRLSTEGRIDWVILDEIDGRRSIGQIAANLTRSFPGRFSTFEEALSRAIQVAEKRTE